MDGLPERVVAEIVVHCAINKKFPEIRCLPQRKRAPRDIMGGILAGMQLLPETKHRFLGIRPGVVEHRLRTEQRAVEVEARHEAVVVVYRTDCRGAT